LYQNYTRVLCSKLKKPGDEADNSPPYCAKIKNVWSFALPRLMSSVITRLADLCIVLKNMSASCSLGHRVQLLGVAVLDVILVWFMNSFRQIKDLGFLIALCYFLQHVLHTVK
jgi:hypothetical protein